MKILAVHNLYRGLSGETVNFVKETNLLRHHGHEVETHTVDNNNIHGIFNKLATGLGNIYNPFAARALSKKIRQFKPDIIVVYNFYPLLSPSIFREVSRHSIPVSLRLANYRLLCCNGLFFRDDKPCELCISQTIPWAGIKYKCHQNSYLASFSVTAMSFFHELWGTWRHKINSYIALTQFARDKFKTSRLSIPDRLIHVIQNSGIDYGFEEKPEETYFLFAGRVSEEKGIKPLISAFKQLPYPLKIVGDGPLADFVQEEAKNHPNIEYLGRKQPEEVIVFLRKAKAFVFPSLWYEGMPTVIIEALSTGTPVIATDLGGQNEMIIHGENGFKYNWQSQDGLKQSVEDMVRLDDPAYRQLCLGARKDFEAKYTEDIMYHNLIGLFQKLIDEKRTPSH